MFGFDSAFIQQLLNGDKRCFSRFYSETVDVFARFVRGRYSINEGDIQDILSDFYVKLWRVLKSFRGNESQFAGYVWTVFKNHLKDYFKKQREKHFSDFEATEDSPSFEDTLMSDEDVMKFFEKSFNYDRIVTSMKHLDDASYEVIHLKYIESKSYNEISQQLGFSEEAIRKRLSRALYRLRKLLS